MQITGVISFIFCNSCFMNVHINDEKIYVCQAKLLYINASIFSIITYEKNIIFQDYYYQNVTEKSHLLSDEWLY